MCLIEFKKNSIRPATANDYCGGQGGGAVAHDS